MPAWHRSSLTRPWHSVMCTASARSGWRVGVFQNRVLAELAEARLVAAGFEVLLPARMPCNDAAISFGQVVEAVARQEQQQ